MSWEDHWATDNTPWDAGAASPCLEKLAETLGPPPGARALVPGCGSGYDVFLLAQSGFSAVGVDIAPSARDRFEKLRLAQALNEERSQIHSADFFSLSPERLGGRFDFVWDYTFYCAIEPHERAKWKEQMLSLLAPGGTLAMLLFPVLAGAPADEGPPYPLDPQEVTDRLHPEMTRVALMRPHSSHPGRQGKEVLAVFQRASNHH
jgi:SAM-dependent methyltransferase